jgi:predicted nucleic acid-binding protein
MVIVDTTVWIDYLRGTENSETVWLDGALTRQRLGLIDLVLCEVLQGIRDPNMFIKVRDELLTFHLFQTGGKDLAITSALNYRKVSDRGYTVRRTIDCLIASFCLEAGHEVLHRDRDFDPFEKALGLRVVHP